MEKFLNLEFYDFSIKINKSLTVPDLASPGIFAVYCIIKKRIFFVETFDILHGVENFFQDLTTGVIQNDQLLSDFKLYGKECFTFYIFDANFELENSIIRKNQLSQYLKLYSDILYNK